MRLRRRPTAKLITPLGENIQLRRLACGLSVQQLCFASQIALSTYYYILNGSRESSLEIIYKIAAALDCEAWQLLKPNYYAMLNHEQITFEKESMECVCN